MKNIQIFDGADNAVHDIFSATDEEFALVFVTGTYVKFFDEVYHPSFERGSPRNLETPRAKARGNGHSWNPLYECVHKKACYPTRRDEEALDPDGPRLR